jgi:5-methylcytosine-specific restriction endonuclease McrA
LDRINFVNLNHLKKNPPGNEAVQAENGNWVQAANLRIFLEISEEEVFPKTEKIKTPGQNETKRKKSRTRIPQQTKVRAVLQKEINNRCPFCPSEEVGHFEIHHIDENPGNNTTSNLMLVCPTCHSKINKGDIKKEAVAKRKKQLKIISNC